MQYLGAHIATTAVTHGLRLAALRTGLRAAVAALETLGLYALLTLIWGVIVYLMLGTIAGS